MGTTDTNSPGPAVTTIGNHRAPRGPLNGWVPPVLTGNHPNPNRVDAMSSAFLAFIRALPEWHRNAACATRPDINFYPTSGQTSAPAKAICATCAVKAACLWWAIEHDEHGIWGGTDATERKQIRNTRQQRKAGLTDGST